MNKTKIFNFLESRQTNLLFEYIVKLFLLATASLPVNIPVNIWCMFRQTLDFIKIKQVKYINKLCSLLFYLFKFNQIGLRIKLYSNKF